MVCLHDFIIYVLCSYLSATILVIIFSDFLMFHQIFLSPQGKRIVIISNKHGIYELPQELLNDLRLRKLEKEEDLNIHPK